MQIIANIHGSLHELCNLTAAVTVATAAAADDDDAMMMMIE